MPWWAWVVGALLIFLVLAVIGYLMGPQGGRAITLLQSTAMEGAVSRIVPKLEEGEMVTIPRFFADTVVTEYGAANLVGKNHRERAEALIGVAHPDFRSELRKATQGWLF